MRAALRRLPWDRLLPIGTAATVFVVACGSSSVHDAARVGRPLRWVFLVGLLVLAAACASVVDRRPALPPRLAGGAVLFLAALAIVSAAWSVDPRLSFERGVSFALLLGAGVALAATRLVAPVLTGVVAGAAAVAVAGLVVLAVDHGAAVSPASYEVPARFQGFGENPNTAALLYGLAIPLAVALVAAAGSTRRRALAAAVTLFLAGSLVASGSRGALVAAAVGSLVVALGAFAAVRTRAGVAAAVVALAAIGAVVEALPQPTKLPPRSTVTATQKQQPAPKPKLPRYYAADNWYPLDADVGGPLPGGGQPTITRHFFGSSGRVDAWIGTIHQAAQRPLLGFGFGTEARVFVDRYYYFVGGLPENAYIGLALQLGLVGLALFALVVVAVAAAGLRDVRLGRPLTAGALGALCAGLVVAVVQSYFYSAGDIASLTFWTSIFCVPVAAGAAA